MYILTTVFVYPRRCIVPSLLQQRICLKRTLRPQGGDANCQVPPLKNKSRRNTPEKKQKTWFHKVTGSTVFRIAAALALLDLSARGLQGLGIDKVVLRNLKEYPALLSRHIPIILTSVQNDLRKSRGQFRQHSAKHEYANYVKIAI